MAIDVAVRGMEEAGFGFVGLWIRRMVGLNWRAGMGLVI